MSDDEKREILRAAIGPHTARWAEGKGLLMLLNSLEHAWPHLFALPAAALEGKEWPWVARDESDPTLEKAYKRAALHLHPDRLVSQNRDLSVRVEAEEVRAHPAHPAHPAHGHTHGHGHGHGSGPRVVVRPPLALSFRWRQVFKQLQAALSDKPTWLVGKEAANPFAPKAP